MGKYNYFSYDIDFQQARCDTTLSQFRWDDPVLNGINHATVNQACVTFCDILNALKARDVENAVDYNLDVIGKWVGESRVFAFFSRIEYFAPDTDFTVDLAPVYVENGEIFGPGLVNNDEYRRNILARIFKNHVKYGSIPEVIQFAKSAFNVNISLRSEGAYDWKLLIQADTQESIVEALTSSVTNNNFDESYYLPIPIGRRLVSTVFTPTPAFRPDSNDAGADIGLLSVGTF